MKKAKVKTPESNEEKNGDGLGERGREKAGKRKLAKAER